MNAGAVAAAAVGRHQQTIRLGIAGLAERCHQRVAELLALQGRGPVLQEGTPVADC
jgi:hypothetical protein